MEPEDIAALCSLPVVVELCEAISNSDAPSFAMTKEQTLSFLRNVIETPISDIDQNSPLCQEVKFSAETGEVTHVKAIDKLKALDMSNKIQGHYAPDKLDVDPGDEMMKILQETRKS